MYIYIYVYIYIYIYIYIYSRPGLFASSGTYEVVSRTLYFETGQKGV